MNILIRVLERHWPNGPQGRTLTMTRCLIRRWPALNGRLPGAWRADWYMHVVNCGTSHCFGPYDYAEVLRSGAAWQRYRGVSLYRAVPPETPPDPGFPCPAKGHVLSAVGN